MTGTDSTQSLTRSPPNLGYPSFKDFGLLEHLYFSEGSGAIATVGEIVHACASAWHWLLDQLEVVMEFFPALWASVIGFLTTDSAKQVELRVLTILLGIVAAWVIGWLRRKMFVEFDRSILVRIAAEGEDMESFVNWPILVGPLPFASFSNETVPNVQAKDVVGFIVGAPRYIDDPAKWNLHGWEPGYFAYGIIHWEHFGEVRAFVKRGYYLQQAFLPNEKGGPSTLTGSRFLRFVTDSQEQQGVPDTIEGGRASIRFKPYAKLGFVSSDLAYRRLSLQLSLWFWLCRCVNRIVRLLGRPYHCLWLFPRWILRMAKKIKEQYG